MIPDLINLILLAPECVAERVGCLRETLATWRYHRSRLAFVHVESLPRYTGEEVARFLNWTCVTVSPTPISASRDLPLVHPIRIPLDDPAGAWHVSAHDLAKLWQVKISTLSAWRMRSQGPAWIRHPISGRPLYSVAALEHYLRERRTDIMIQMNSNRMGPNRSAASQPNRAQRKPETTASTHLEISAHHLSTSNSVGDVATAERPAGRAVSTDGYPDMIDDTTRDDHDALSICPPVAEPLPMIFHHPRVNPGTPYTMEAMVAIGIRNGLTEDFVRSL